MRWQYMSHFAMAYLIAVMSSLISASCSPHRHLEATWTRSFGGLGDDWPWGGIVEAGGGGYVVAGNTDWSETNRTGYVVRINTGGDTLWTRTLATSSIRSVIPLADSGYIVAADTGAFKSLRQACLFRLDNRGRLLWMRAYPHGKYCYVRDVAETQQKGLLFVGTTSSPGDDNQDVLLAKTDSLGDIVWTRTYGGPGNEQPSAIVLTPTGDIAVFGTTTSIGSGADDFFLTVFDGAGNVLWSRAYGTPRVEIAHGIRVTSDGGFIMVGVRTRESGVGWLIFLVRATSRGDTLWTSTYGSQFNDASAGDVELAPNGSGFMIGGRARRDKTTYLWLLRTDAQGAVLWSEQCGSHDFQEALSVIQNPESGYAIAGVAENYGSKQGTDWEVLSTTPDRTTEP